ncbi:hypothetical protein GCM10008927_26070 [Amylibacter ulvae]|uniref:DUF533 domain-containing protein n=1 Tax=Paramylibacter ulvae TaxID=1651968 RepID=A0ABQ3D800_9RHOB|nr:DUF533 domain-containing protein [Amylibacter ulvae]GHA59321.1 hypothetical protein GCM10008927_26070 [Amylibacter ulvae]
MSLVGTLAKLAVGYAVARGVKSVIGGGGAAKSGGGSVFGGSASGQSTGLEGIMESITGGQTGGTTSASTGGGIGDLLGQLGGGKSAGGIGDILGQLGGGASSAGAGAGGLGGLLGQLGAGSAAGGLGGMLNDALSGSAGGLGNVQEKPSQKEEAAAGLMIRAMLQAAKADGSVDETEKQQLLQHLGDLDQDEINFVNAEMNRGIDIRGLAADVPNGMEQQVYMMSLMGINLDNQNEAQYLNDLANAMNIGKQQVNQIHQMLGVQPLYA